MRAWIHALQCNYNRPDGEGQMSAVIQCGKDKNITQCLLQRGNKSVNSAHLQLRINSNENLEVQMGLCQRGKSKVVARTDYISLRTHYTNMATQYLGT